MRSLITDSKNKKFLIGAYFGSIYILWNLSTLVIDDYMTTYNYFFSLGLIQTNPHEVPHAIAISITGIAAFAYYKWAEEGKKPYLLVWFAFMVADVFTNVSFKSNGFSPELFWSAVVYSIVIHTIMTDLGCMWLLSFVLNQTGPFFSEISGLFDGGEDQQIQGMKMR